MTLFALWGKTRRGADVGDPTHALVYHLLDVAAVAEALWETALPRAVRQILVEGLSLTDVEAQRNVSLLAALHDLGKACPAFQMQYGPAVPVLQAAGLPLPMQGTPCYHGTVSAHVLQDLLRDPLGLDRRGALALSRALGGHHGSWPTSLELQALTSWQMGGAEWQAIRLGLLESLVTDLAPALPLRWPGSQTEGNAFATLLAGVTSVADWIGSMNRFFPYCAAPQNLAKYLERARGQARTALRQLRWERLPLDGEALQFRRMFPGYQPNPVQQAAIGLAPHLQHPSLVIIEAPTGTGKTEASLYLAEHEAIRQGQLGLYIAMPTTATSNQMHERLGELVARRYPSADAPLLVHSQALWQGPPPAVSTGEIEGGDGIEAQSWFLPRKRSLLAPLGVGTVDQTFLGVLQTRHFFVRLLGLAGKTIIFDEVHAYDTYMTTLFVRLLEWLRAMGSSVVLLSATLPTATRRQLLAAYGQSATAEAPYPAIHWQSAGQGGSLPLAGCPERAIALEWLPRDAEAIVGQLAQRLAEGGTAAVICNTVARAQAVYRAVQEAGLVPPADLLLFHARFPYGWRERVEQEVLARFGKNRPSGQRAIVVATQVIEQSLDLDFDYLISDLAPVDLLIQRAGRLHRHDRPAHERPPALLRPLLGISVPPLEDAEPQWGADGLVYEPYVLLRTLLALRDRREIRTPADTSALIDAVYGGSGVCEAPGWEALLAEAREEMLRHQGIEVDEASKRLVPPVDDSAVLRARNEMLREESPEVHESLRALTRLSPPSVSLVCLHREGARVLADPGGAEVFLERYPDDKTTRVLIRATVSVSHRGLVAALRDGAPPAAWERHPLLRYSRVLIFVDGEARLGAYAVRLSPELGLEIEKEVP